MTLRDYYQNLIITINARSFYVLQVMFEIDIGIRTNLNLQLNSFIYQCDKPL